METYWKVQGGGGGVLKKPEPFKEGRKLIKIKISRGDKDQTKSPFMGGVWTCSKTTPLSQESGMTPINPKICKGKTTDFKILKL